MPELLSTYTKPVPSVTSRLVMASRGRHHAWGRVRLREGQARPERVGNVRGEGGVQATFEWSRCGDLWAFHASCIGRPDEAEALIEAVLVVTEDAACTIDRMQWEPDLAIDQSVFLWNGAMLHYRAGHPVEVEYDEDQDEDPTASTEVALRSSIGVVTLGPEVRSVKTFAHTRKVEVRRTVVAPVASVRV